MVECLFTNSWAKRMAKPISETRNATDVSVLVWFIISWRENSKTQQKKV